MCSSAEKRTSIRTFVSLNGAQSVTQALRDGLTANQNCKHCKHQDVLTRNSCLLVPRNVPLVLLVELTFIGFDSCCTIPGNFEFELTLKCADRTYDCVSVLYRTPGHYIGDTVRRLADGSSGFVRLDDLAGLPPKDGMAEPCPVPTSEVSHELVL